MMAFELGHQSALPGSITACQHSDLDWDISSVDFVFVSLRKSVSHFLITITIFYNNNIIIIEHYNYIIL